MGHFDNQTVIITGASGGMGASHARAFLEQGASVVIADILEDEGKALARELGDRTRFVRLDITRADDWTAAVTAAEDTFGPVSVLINNAGILQYGTIEETEPEVWRRVVEINLTGQYLGIRAVTPSMRRAGGGAIVNVSSVAGLTGGVAPALAAYTASKHGVTGLTKVAALELGRDNIRVNSVHPGTVDTRLAASMAAELASGEGNLAGPVAIPRLAQPEEVSRVVLFLASSHSSFTTGAEYVVDGGMQLGPALQPEQAA
ncbi:glucose 1-dehydrogenase [Actinacidiphila glaucinigra]|uniref:glucose 1-dehydrogenase n=1 Tax=Actinacidiphila glaucinigra TaxID=235986 RepID=UPI003866E8F2